MRPDDIGFPADLLPGPDERAFPMSSGVDLYGDTVFNYIQLGHLLREWSTLDTSAMDDRGISALKGVRTLAERAVAERGFLLFIGD
jgi:hypothetical protein